METRGVMCRNSVRDFFRNHPLERYVLVADRRVRIPYLFLFVVIVVLIIVYVSIAEKYLQHEEVRGTVTTKLRGLIFTNISDERGIGTRTWDIADLMIPPKDNNAFFVMTNIGTITKQRQTTCAENPALEGVNCTLDQSVCQAKKGRIVGDGNGPLTGKCVDTPYPASSGTKSCEVLGWCPVEIDEMTEEAVLGHSENFTVFIRNDVEFPRFGLERRNFLDQQDLSTCRYNSKSSEGRFCPIFTLKTIMEGAGVKFEDIVIEGGVIQIIIDWTCNLMYSDCTSPDYIFRHVARGGGVWSRGFNFRYAQKFMDGDTLFRRVYRVYGLRFIVILRGRFSDFSFVNTVLAIGSCFGLFGGLSLLFNSCLRSCCTERIRNKVYTSIPDHDNEMTSKTSSPTDDIMDNFRDEVQHLTVMTGRLSKEKSVFHPLTVATMSGHPRRKTSKKLHPSTCYAIRSVVAVGKFGAFYGALEGKNKRERLIKVYRPNILKGSPEAGLEKMILSLRYPSPFLPLLIRSFRFEFQNVLVLENMVAYSLKEKLGTAWKLKVDTALFYLAEMIVAVSFLHQRGIMHRRKFQMRGQKVDNYTAPELLYRGFYTKMVDIWALGVMAFRMISGRMPFYSASSAGLRLNVLRTQEVYADCFPACCIQLCAFMLQKRPEHRLGWGMLTSTAFQHMPIFRGVQWDHVANLQYAHPHEDRIPVLYSPLTARSTLSMRLDFQKFNSKLLKLRKKPFRFRDITTKSAVELFGFDNDFGQALSLGSDSWSEQWSWNEDDYEIANSTDR